MKKFKLILVLAVSAILVSSCDADQLELTNPNELSPESFFKTEAQVQSAVNAVYANLQTRGLYTRHMFFMMDNMAHENGGNTQLESDKKQYLDFSFDSSHGPIADFWDSCYRGINKANFVLGNEDRINEIPDAFLSPERKAKFLGEAKFLRGLYYFMLVTRWGDIPLYKDIPEGAEGAPRSPQSEVYAQIVEDFTEAAVTLLDRGEEDTGRATKGAAQAMLGKVKLFMGDKAGAMTAFNSLSGYSLEANFFDNFMEETEHGIESIFEVEYDDNLGDGAKWNSSVNGQGPNEVTFRGQEYGFNDWFNVFVSDDLLNEYEEGDIRKAESFYFNGDTYAGGVVTQFPSNGGGNAGWRKYQNYYKDANEDQASGINMKVIRYADVLLMMAECASSPTEAAGYINQVRERAELPTISPVSDQDVFDAIVHERKCELAGEQVRFQDIMRWGIASTALAGTNFTAGKNELLPIPDREISSNENISDADQNPGY